MKKALASVAMVVAILAICGSALAEDAVDVAKLKRELGSRLSAEKFAKVDANGDGQLTPAEIRAAKAAGVFDPGAWGLTNWKNADKNGDGKVSHAEARIARYHHLAGRIRHGIKSGALTKEEAAGLIATQKEIHGMKVEAKSDGTVTKDERIEIHKAVREQSKAIYREKHDDEGKKLPKPDPKKTPGVAARQHIQKNRIGQGIKSGEVTKGEAKMLISGQKKIQHMKKDMKSDGKVTIKERKVLNKVQTKQSKKIYRAKHNDRSRTSTKKRPRRK
jgi:EF hand domain-containing protein